MYTGTLRKVGGSTMLALPPAILDILQLKPQDRVHMTVDAGRLIIESIRGKKYSLEELLAQCDAPAPLSDEDSTWTGSRPVGRELV